MLCLYRTKPPDEHIFEMGNKFLKEFLSIGENKKCFRKYSLQTEEK
jgi:hypothetical protein